MSTALSLAGAEREDEATVDRINRIMEARRLLPSVLCFHRDAADKIQHDPYRFLACADKFQAGYDEFGNIEWSDEDRVHRLITVEIPTKVAADPAFQNARKNSDKENARIEHDKALRRVMTAVLKDDTELFEQFMDNQAFRRWLTDTVFDATYR